MERLIDTCSMLIAERAAIVRVLDEFGPSWCETRTALNQLARIVRGT
jgi:hypothetical protein